MQAMILAGGLGTRLREVLPDRPKPMVELVDKPVIVHQIDALRSYGVTRVVLCVGHLAHVIEESLGDGSRLGVEIAYSVEEELLGTAGAIGHARELVGDDPFFVLNGDTVVQDLDYRALYRQHRERTASVPRTAASLVVVRPPDPGAYGVVEVESAPRSVPASAADETSRIVGFREKAPVKPASALISGGVYLLEPDVLDEIPGGRPVSIEFEVFPRLLETGRVLWAVRHDGFFGDVGTPDGLERVRRHLDGSRERQATADSRAGLARDRKETR